MKFKYKFKRGDNIAYKELDGKEIEIRASQQVHLPYQRFRLDNGLLIDIDELVIETQEQTNFLKLLPLTRRILGAN